MANYVIIPITSCIKIEKSCFDKGLPAPSVKIMQQVLRYVR